MNTQSLYPIDAGHKSGTASHRAAQAVDADPLRRFNTYCLIAFAAAKSGHLTADEIGELIGEALLYIRPRTSELVSLGIVKKGGLKLSTTHGRQAHAISASFRTKWTVLRARDDDEAMLKLGELILDAQDTHRQARMTK